MSSLFSAAGFRPPGEIPPRPAGEMPPIDPSSIETDETMNAIIVRTDTGKLTVTRRETRRQTDPTSMAPDSADGEADESNRDR